MSQKLKTILQTGQAWVAILAFLGGVFWWITRVEVRAMSSESQIRVLTADCKALEGIIAGMNSCFCVLTNDIGKLQESMEELKTIHKRTN